MSRKLSHKDCFDFFGVVPKNPRWSWSGRSPDGKIVAVTFWQDLFEEKGRIYRTKQRPTVESMSKPGRTELLENLKWAHENCEGVIRIIIAIAKDKEANPRAIKECFPQKSLRMRITSLDMMTGEFVAERIEQAA